jgi:uncharacterized protein YuzE
LDQEVNALYIKVGPGTVARTIVLTDTVYVDVDAEGMPVGIEFTDADEFVPFLRNHADDADLPASVRELFRVTSA